MSGMADVINLLERPLYGFNQVDRILGLVGGTASRWIDGYERMGKPYAPVIREERTGSEIVTWGEFVETRLLSEYRDAGVPLIHMRPVIEGLREELNTRYPLASAQTWLAPAGRELVRRVQDYVGLKDQLALVEIRTGQAVLWSKPAETFRRSVAWTNVEDPKAQPQSIQLDPEIKEVRVDPRLGFGEPVVKGIRTEIIGELHRAGDSNELIADLYELTPRQVDAAVEFEERRAA